VQRSAGSGLAPMDCFLVSRGLKTLAIRMLQHNANGIAVARHLDAHPKIKRVHYPGLASHPQHDIARKQQRGPGAMLAFDLGSLDAARRFLNQVKLCSLAESLGGVETLISLPALMTPRLHACRGSRTRWHYGRSGALSVGIEDVEDIIADLDQALLYRLSAPTSFQRISVMIWSRVPYSVEAKPNTSLSCNYRQHDKFGTS